MPVRTHLRLSGFRHLLFVLFKSHIPLDVEWCVEEYLSQYHFGQLTAIDNLEHPDTTAHLVVELAEKLG